MCRGTNCTDAAHDPPSHSPALAIAVGAAAEGRVDVDLGIGVGDWGQTAMVHLFRGLGADRRGAFVPVAQNATYTTAGQLTGWQEAVDSGGTIFQTLSRTYDPLRGFPVIAVPD